MDSVSAELKELAQMSMVKKRKQSFAGGIDAFEHSIDADLISTVPTHPELTEPGEDCTVEHVNRQPNNDDHFKQSFAGDIDAHERSAEADLTQCLILTVPTHSEPSEDTVEHINRQPSNDDYLMQSFAGEIDVYERSVEADLILTRPTHSEPSEDTVEHINCQPTNDGLQIDVSDSSDTGTSGGNAEQCPATPAGILSTVVSSREAVDESGHGTWPRKRRLASVRFTDQADCDMVRQKENGSRLAAASSIEWGNITDNGYIDDAGTSQKNTGGASIEDDLVIPNWRKETPLPVLGNENMSWKERQAKLQDALEWLRNEIGEMKKQDQLLMCQFIQLRSDIHTLKFTSSRRKTKTNTTGSCEDLIENEQLRPNNMATSMIKFQSTMTLDRHRGHERSPHQHMHDDDDEDEEDDDDEDEDDEDEDDDERTLLEPEYLPEFRTRTMSLLPPVQARRMARIRTTRNKSFSAGTDENTDRGLTDVLE